VRNPKTIPLGLAWAIAGALTGSLPAATIPDYAVRASATANTNPPAITLSWPADPAAVEYTIYRKAPADTSWGDALTTLAGNASAYTDSNVAVGGAYEYRISKSASGYSGVGYLYAGIAVPLPESRGKVILVVDQTHTLALTQELARLQADLAGDGWAVVRHDVPRMAVPASDNTPGSWAARSNELAAVKALIAGDYNADPAHVRAVFLFGHVPVPYSGDIAPDDHVDHAGAWPADAYYGELSGAWPDTTVLNQGASDPRNRNTAGDGKFDPSSLPSDVDLEVGRVDFANLPAFSASEEELLRRYLNKNHSYRHKLTTAERRGLIDDHLGLLNGQKPALNGWRNFAPFFGAANTFTGDWQTTLATQSYLWGYGCGAGTYTSCSGVATTTELAAADPRVVFTMFFGSYFGDWDSQNNLLRAAIATPTYTLTSAWVGRPYWQFHHMGLGETIGYGTRLSQNNESLYSSGFYARWVHTALMGDPTLRLHMVAPVSNVAVVASGTGGAVVSWTASPEAVLGYHVYKSATVAGPFTRVNADLVTSTSYTDPDSPTACVYMVRAVKLEVAASGSYYNASTGIFAEFAGEAQKPVLTISAQDTNKVYGAELPAFVALYSGFVDGDTTNVLDSLPVLSTSATASSPAGQYLISVSGAACAKYSIRYVDGTLTVQPAATSGVLNTSANPALPAVPVTFTMALNAVPPGAGTPSGTVQFKADGAAIGAPVPLAEGAASYTTATLTHGSRVISAEYTGDANFLGSTTTLTPSQVINTAPAPGTDTIERTASSATKVSVAFLLANDTDADGDAVIFDGVAATSTHQGTVTHSDGWVFYVPAAGFTNADTFVYYVKDAYSAPVGAVVNVSIRQDNAPSPNLAITDLGNGSVAIRGDGIPGFLYRIQYAEAAQEPDWNDLATVQADASGFFTFIDNNASPQRFYRTVWP